MKALEVWYQISNSKICKEAVDFYQFHKVSKHDILKKGAANFDQKVTDESGEKEHYRAVYYMSQNGYMDMHIRQNLTAFEAYLGDLKDHRGHVLFVDFGCGPMTSGLALAEFFSNSTPNYKTSFHYLGIDVSNIMRTLAEGINLNFKIFDEKRLRMAVSLEDVIEQIKNCTNIVILSLSFVFGRDTLSGITGKYVAKTWVKLLMAKPEISEFRVIFLNPQSKQNPDWSSQQFNVHWDQFYNELMNASDFELSYTEIEDCFWLTGRDPSAMAMIKGIKKAES